ncbi:FG-GAP-like repeat-containing protein [Lutibacter sp.]|uniref:FG-GAP-like repeat-containing protein n=1 Tax=Lutibacter sp. TaxID=1925666 RepID=UPI002732E692|nr:FG-GAP-like repeat-containing protein [Lutibacter sp.]MDP3314037.1 FG-GAP-like repeat-containing protein [Lutibacter sp.]
MKNILNLFVLTLFIVALSSCKNSEKEDKGKAVELMTSQTLGLAYLEEFKLEDAEKEFLKVIEMAPNEKLGYANLGLTYLRMGNYKDAEKQLFKAIEIDVKDADLMLLLATVYKMDSKNEKAINTLINALKFAPDHIKILYELTEFYTLEFNNESQKKRFDYLKLLVEKAAGNIVPQLNITEIYIKNGETDNALAQLEIIQKQFPEFPKEAIPYFDKTMSLLKKKDEENALTQFMIFHNYLKVSFPYQNGIMDLKGPGGSLIGFPLITFDKQDSSTELSSSKSIIEAIKFTDITASAGLDIVPTFEEGKFLEYKNSTFIEIADYDGDGEIDIYVGSFNPTTKTFQHYLFNNDMARFKDVSKEVGLKFTGNESSAIFADYDNDGFLDLFITREEGDLLYKNVGKGIFENVTKKAKLENSKGGKKSLFVDFDHDGDLDLFVSKLNSNVVFQNNGDGTFTDNTNKMGLFGTGTNCSNATFGDFDDDGDIDLLVANENTKNVLYSNQRQGIFRDITKNTGLKETRGSSSLAVGDFNNDGFLDVFITSSTGETSELYKNLGNAKFELIKGTNNFFDKLINVKVFDSKFFDFDNDGLLDIIIVGESKQKGGQGVFLYHNEGSEKFKNVSHLLPETLKSGKQIKLFDYNDDGDLDLVIAKLNGGISLLRNDGGNNNHYLSMKLVGLRTGSAKNNYFGIGSKVEVRSGDLYQTMIVTSPNVYFGLGNRTRADIIRITWTNGVPQNIFLPEADQALIEAQTLKGSCPFIYGWNGNKFEFVKDITWRSALGMPLGIMGGNTMHAFANASDDYIKIPGELLKPKNGEYILQLTSELWETIYMDKIQLIAVDHPENIDVFVPEQFSPPPFPGMDIYQVEKKIEPISAKDDFGNDVLSLITKKDDKYISNFKPWKYQGTTELHDLIIDPGEVGKSKELYLFLNGWIFPTDASINVALSQSDNFKLIQPSIQVKNKKGEWETVIENLGFPMGKDKTVIANLSGKFLSNDHRIRIQTNMEIYWDYVFFSNSNPNASIETTVLNPTYANIHYRGFSQTYKKGGRYGPHWFDYYNVDKNKKWRDLIGNYTRYGDVLPLLLESDNKYIISNGGDETTLKFNANMLPPLKKGWKRDFLIHSVGWVKDGDINTALGSTVLPLPFHGMSSYPPTKMDVYPSTKELQKYNKEYNTRIITSDDYRNVLKKLN